MTPLVVAQGMVTAQNEGRRVAQARVYGVDDRFWTFHGVSGVKGPENRDAFLSPALAQTDSAPARATRSSCACSDRPTFRSSRCTVSATTWGARFG